MIKRVVISVKIKYLYPHMIYIYMHIHRERERETARIIYRKITELGWNSRKPR